jgi:hypothetical protein
MHIEVAHTPSPLGNRLVNGCYKTWGFIKACFDPKILLLTGDKPKYFAFGEMKKVLKIANWSITFGVVIIMF